MATIKAYTDLEQSKTLAKILPLESADMHYSLDIDFMEHESVPIVTEEDDHFELFQSDIPCWSLASLIKMLPKGFLLMDNQGESESSLYSVWVPGFDKPHIWKHNTVDAVFEMIIWLKENDKLYELRAIKEVSKDITNNKY